MTTKIDTIFEESIIANLNKISIANGDLNDISVIDGFLVHYANDLLSEDNALSFPCLAAQLDNDTVSLQKNNTEGIITRDVKIVGAVSVKDRALVNRNLNSLVFDARKALAFDKSDPRATQAKSIKIGGAIFSLPKQNDQYAYFEITITIEYTEQWK